MIIRLIAYVIHSFLFAVTSSMVRILIFRKVRIGVPHYPPFSQSENIDETWGGKIINNIALRKNMKFEIIPFAWNEISGLMNERKVDFIFPLFSTDSKRADGDFTEPFFRFYVNAVQKKDCENIDHPNRLKDPKIKIGVIDGEIGHEYCKRFLQLEKDASRFKVYQSTDIRELLKALQNGAFDVAICDALSGLQSIRASKISDEPELKFSLRAYPLYVCNQAAMYIKNDVFLGNWLQKEINISRHDLAIQNYEKELAKEFAIVLHRIEPDELGL